MLYQVGLILILVAIALIFSKKFKKSDEEKSKYIYEEDMDKDELDDLDDEIN